MTLCLRFFLSVSVQVSIDIDIGMVCISRLGIWALE